MRRSDFKRLTFSGNLCPFCGNLFPESQEPEHDYEEGECAFCGQTVFLDPVSQEAEVGGVYLGLSMDILKNVGTA